MAKHIFELTGLLLIYSQMCFFSCALDPSVDITTGIDNYIENMSEQCKNEINALDAQVTQTELALTKQLLVIAYSQELAAKLQRKVESRLRSRGTFNLKGRLCLQNFIGNVTVENTALQTRLRACVDAARNSAKTLADGARTQVRNSRQQLTDLMNNDIPTCRKTNTNNAQKLADCVWDKCKARETNLINCVKAGGREIEGSSCKAETLVKIAQECSFTHLLNTQTLMAETVMSYNTCVGEKSVEIRN